MSDLVQPIALLRSGRFPAGGKEFTAVGFTSAGHPSRIVELAAVRLRADGTVLGELSARVDAGSLGEVAGHFVALCRGSVLVLHDQPHEARLLAAALTRLGVPMPMLPGVRTLDRLTPATRDLDRARTTLARARLIATLLGEHPLTFAEQPRFRRLPILPIGTPHLTTWHPTDARIAEAGASLVRAAHQETSPQPSAGREHLSAPLPHEPVNSHGRSRADAAWPHDAHAWTAWATMCIGLCLMFVTVAALFGGASAAFGVVFGAVGAGALVYGWRSGGPHSTVD